MKSLRVSANLDLVTGWRWGIGQYSRFEPPTQAEIRSVTPIPQCSMCRFRGTRIAWTPSAAHQPSCALWGRLCRVTISPSRVGGPWRWWEYGSRTRVQDS